MELPPFTFFAQIEMIEKLSDLCEIFKKEGFYFYYFKSNKSYYLLVYAKHHLSNSFNSILSSLVVIEELDTKKRKIRSVRGLLIYAWEIIQDEKLITVIKTNFHPLFWSRLKNVLRQNKKNHLLSFLFEDSNAINRLFTQEQIVETVEKIKSEVLQLKKLENKVLLLEEKVEILNKLKSEPSKDSVIVQEFDLLTDLSKNDKEKLIKTGVELANQK